MEFPPDEVEDFADRLRGEPPDAWSFESFDTEQAALDFTNFCLSTAYKDSGFLLWWNKPNRMLGGRRAIDVWKESPQDVIDLAVRLATL